MLGGGATAGRIDAPHAGVARTKMLRGAGIVRNGGPAGQVLRTVLARVDVLGWDARGTCPADAEDGACVSVEGEFAGRKVWVRVLAYAPGDVGPAAKVDANPRRRAG